MVPWSGSHQRCFQVFISSNKLLNNSCLSHLCNKVFYLTSGDGKESWESTCVVFKQSLVFQKTWVFHMLQWSLESVPRGILTTASFLLWKNCTISHRFGGINSYIIPLGALSCFCTCLFLRILILAFSSTAARCCNISPYYTNPCAFSLPCISCRLTASKTK